MKEKIIVSRIGDGFISIFTDKNSYLLSDNKKDSFSNITMAFSKNFNIDDVECLEIKNEKFKGLINIDTYDESISRPVRFILGLPKRVSEEDMCRPYPTGNLNRLYKSFRKTCSQEYTNIGTWLLIIAPQVQALGTEFHNYII